jgi:hypothetical protein
MRDPQIPSDNTVDRLIPLIEEYKLCDEKAARLEGYIWQTAALFGIGSIVSLVATAKEFSETPENTAVPTIIAAIFGILASLVWWRFARRWWSIQHLMFERMREVDGETGSRMSVIVEERDSESYANRRYHQLHGTWISKLYNKYFYIPRNTQPKLSDRVNDFEYRGMRESARLLVCTTIGLWVVLAAYAIYLSSCRLPFAIIIFTFFILTLYLWRKM